MDVPLALKSVTVSSSQYGVPTQAEDGSILDWETRLPEATVLIKLPSHHLLSKLILRNKSTSLVTVRIGMNPKKLRSFLTVVEDSRLPHDRVTEFKIGHLPCRYVQIVCKREPPKEGLGDLHHSIGLAGFTVTGISLGDMRRRSGQPGLAPLLFDGPTRILFDEEATATPLDSEKQSALRRSKQNPAPEKA
jgi:hypothetical protein